MTHFYNNISDIPEELLGYRDELKVELKGEYPLTNRIGILYNAFKTYKQISELSGSCYPSGYRSYMYYNSISGSCAGQYIVSYNGYAEGLTRLVQV